MDLDSEFNRLDPDEWLVDLDASRSVDGTHSTNHPRQLARPKLLHAEAGKQSQRPHTYTAASRIHAGWCPYKLLTQPRAYF